jgi:hypothetical protein
VTADNVEYLPLWKKDATPEEFFYECAMVARKHPDWAMKILVCAYEETPDGKGFKTRLWRHKTTGILETLGLLDECKMRYILEVYGL